MVTEAKKKLFTVDEYYAMGRVGILAETDRVELIEGEIIEMSPVGSRHQATVDALTQLLITASADRAIVRVQGPLRLADITEPEPDVQLLVRRDDFYVDSHPTQFDVLLVIEVAETSLAYDRDEKSVVYSQRDVPELWVMDIVTPRLLVMRDPTDEGYRTVLELEIGDAVSPLSLADLTFSVEDLLGPIV